MSKIVCLNYACLPKSVHIYHVAQNFNGFVYDQSAKSFYPSRFAVQSSQSAIKFFPPKFFVHTAKVLYYVYGNL